MKKAAKKDSTETCFQWICQWRNCDGVREWSYYELMVKGRPFCLKCEREMYCIE